MVRGNFILIISQGIFDGQCKLESRLYLAMLIFFMNFSSISFTADEKIKGITYGLACKIKNGIKTTHPFFLNVYSTHH